MQAEPSAACLRPPTRACMENTQTTVSPRRRVRWAVCSARSLAEVEATGYCRGRGGVGVVVGGGCGGGGGVWWWGEGVVVGRVRCEGTRCAGAGSARPAHLAADTDAEEELHHGEHREEHARVGAVRCTDQDADCDAGGWVSTEGARVTCVRTVIIDAR